MTHKARVCDRSPTFPPRPPMMSPEGAGALFAAVSAGARGMGLHHLQHRGAVLGGVKGTGRFSMVCY